MDLPGFLQSKPNILSVKYKKTVDGQLLAKLVDFIQTTSKKSPKIIIEVSGTINSLVSGVILKKALGEKAIAIIFDFDTPKTEELISICTKLNFNAYVLKRGGFYQKELASYHLHRQEDIANFYRRFVNYHLSVQADIMKAQIADTEDKSDRLTKPRPNAFYGSFMPFYSLYKTEIYDLARILNIDLPANYDYWKKLDPILFLLTEKQNSPEEIAQEFNLDLEWLKKLKRQIDKQSLESTVNQFII